MNIRKIHQIIKEEYVKVMLQHRIDETTINLSPEEMDKLHSDGSVNVGEDTVTYEEPENPTPVEEGKLTEAKPKKVTKQMWAKMDEYQRIDALLTVVKDPNKAEKFLDKKWNQLPSGFERDMYTEAYEPPKKADGTVDWEAIANDPKNLHKNPKKGFYAKHLRAVSKLIKVGTKASVKDGEDKLYKLSQDFERWNADNDDIYDDLVDPLFAAVELVQDAGTVKDKEYYSYMKSAAKHLKQFNKDCVKALKEIGKLKEGKLNEISTEAGLKDVMKGSTSAIEGVKMSKAVAAGLLNWIQMSSYGRRYGKQIMRGRIHSVIGPANSMGIERYLGSKGKQEWKVLYAKYGPKREAVVEQLKELNERFDKLPDVSFKRLARPPKRFTVHQPFTIDGTNYSKGDYALKKKRSGGGIYLNMDKGEMLGIDTDNIARMQKADYGIYEGKLKEAKVTGAIDKASIQHLALDYLKGTNTLSKISREAFQTWLKGLKNSYNNTQARLEIMKLVKLGNLAPNKSKHQKWMKDMLGEGKLKEINLREMIYSELFDVLREDSEKEDKKDILLGKKYEAIDLGKVFKKGKVKATYAGRKVEINREGKNPKDWTITFVDTGKTVPFIDGIANLTLEVSAVKGKISPSGKTGVKKVKKFTNKLKKVFGMLGV